MIPHAAALDDAYGTSAWAPFTRVILASPTSTGSESQVVAESVEGTLTLSDTNWPRATLEMTVPAGVTAADTDAPVTPYGGRVIIEMGATIGGSRYTFQVHDLDVAEVFLERPTNAWTIRAVSAEARVNEDRPAAGLDLSDWGDTVTAVVSEISQRLQKPGVIGPIPYTSTLTDNATILASDGFGTFGDVWPVIEAAMDAAGGEAYFRYDRRLILRDDPVIGSPVTSLKVGAGGTITDYRDVQRWAYNVVHVVFTDATGNHGTGVWENTTPGSPTLPTGAYGRHVKVVERSCTTLPTTTRMNAWAASVARRAAAPFRRIELDCVPAPWLEPGDTVAVTLLEGTATNRLVSGVRIPLSQLESMTLTLHDSGL